METLRYFCIASVPPPFHPFFSQSRIIFCLLISEQLKDQLSISLKRRQRRSRAVLHGPKDWYLCYKEAFYGLLQRALYSARSQGKGKLGRQKTRLKTLQFSFLSLNHPHLTLPYNRLLPRALRSSSAEMHDLFFIIYIILFSLKEMNVLLEYSVSRWNYF